MASGSNNEQCYLFVKLRTMRLLFQITNNASIVSSNEQCISVGSNNEQCISIGLNNEQCISIGSNNETV